MSSINSLLNHEPAPDQRRASRSSIPQDYSHDYVDNERYGPSQTTTQEAADALTTLATLGKGVHYAHVRELPEPAVVAKERRTSSFDSKEMPSPTLYSKERRTSSFGSHGPPEELRRMSNVGAHVAHEGPRRISSVGSISIEPPHRTSSLGSHVAPVEPSPPIEHPQLHSPTLEMYHHGSKSPEEQRRQSLLVGSRTSPPPVLAPIQGLSVVLHERTGLRDGRDEEQDSLSAGTSLGKDMSQMVPPPSRSSNGSRPRELQRDGKDETQDREPGFVREEPTTTQEDLITAQTHQENDIRIPSPLPQIKHEPTGTPRDPSPGTVVPTSERPGSATQEDMDAETRKAIEIAKQNDLGLRTKRTASVAESITSPVASQPAPAPSKKRPALSAIKKKGQAVMKKPAKKRKLNDTDDGSTRSLTPTSRPKSSTKKKGPGSHSGTPAASSPAPEADDASQAHASEADDGESSEDSTLYCICRKPDNHRWMIGCDGGCDDWFHGSCVDMRQEDEELVDKFICPNCVTMGKGETSWKSMCRRQGCRKPARITKDSLSKYCSDECGRLFFEEQLSRTAGAKPEKKKRKKKAKDSNGDEVSVMEEDEDEEPTPLGGVLRAKDLKALAVASADIQTFKNLGSGSGVLSPPQTASPTHSNFNRTSQSPPGNTNGTTDSEYDGYNNSEKGILQALKAEKNELQKSLEHLKDREKFVSMVRGQTAVLAEKHGVKVKEFCGYDPRLAWSDAEFGVWRKSKHGEAAFARGSLSADASVDGEPDANADNVPMTNGDSDHQNDTADASDLFNEASAAKKVCTRKRCQKHPQWQKLNLQDARFEEMEVVESLREVEKQEREVKERAARRRARELVESEVMGGENGKMQCAGSKSREGWVEEVH